MKKGKCSKLLFFNDIIFLEEKEKCEKCESRYSIKDLILDIENSFILGSFFDSTLTFTLLIKKEKDYSLPH